MIQLEQNMACTTIVIFGASGDLTQRKLIPTRTGCPGLDVGL